jgi:hypothetical protein
MTFSTTSKLGALVLISLGFVLLSASPATAQWFDKKGAKKVTKKSKAKLCKTARKKKCRSAGRCFRGEILLTEKRPPKRFDTDGHMVCWLVKHEKKVIKSSVSGRWKFEYMMFLKKPISTLQAQLNYYDISDGTKRHIHTYTYYPSSKKDKILSGDARLKEAQGFKEGHTYLLELSRGFRGKPLAWAKFVLK